MTLHPKVQKYLNTFADWPTLDQLSPQQAREMNDLPTKAGQQALTGLQVRDEHIPTATVSLRVRVYTPKSTSPCPILLYFHGGGWVFGSLEKFDRTCGILASQAGYLVVSVDYRCAPEVKFPTPLEDAYAATVWMQEQGAKWGGNPYKIVVAGDSAGGNLAAGVTLMARDRKSPTIAHQVLLYPVTNYGFDSPSYQQCKVGYGLTEGEMRWCWQHYLNHPTEGENPYASPLKAETLENLPPAQIYVSEYDVLRSEGEAYADRLETAGVPVTRYLGKGLIHGIFSNPQLWDLVTPTLNQIAEKLC